MVKICGFDLGEYDEKILYACAVDKTHDKYTYSMHDMKGVMGQMIEEKEPGFAESPKFATYRGYYDQVVNWRASGQPYIQDLKERVEKDLGELRQRGSELYRRCKDVAPETVVRAPKVRAPKVQGPGPAAFRDPGNRNNLKIVGIVLDDDHLSDIYAAANLIFTSSGEQCTVEVIKAMIVVMLSITGKNNFKVQSVKDYVNVFRQDKDHWVTKLVASWMTGDRPRLHGERAIKLLGKTKHKGAYKLVLPSDDEPATESMQSMTLSAHVPAEALQSSARQRLPGFAESPMWQSTYQSGNPANLPPSASLHHDLSSNPAHRGQPYPGSNIDPRTIGNDQYGSQQPGDQGSNYQFGGSGPQLSSVTGGDFDDFDDFVDMDAHWDFEDEQPTTQPPGPLDPYLQVSAYASASQSGFGQARTEAKGPVTTGDDELYSANDFSSPSGGSDQPPAPQRRRLEQGDSQGRAEQSQRYAAAGQEKRKKDSKHARGSQEKGKKTSKNKKDDSQKEKSTSTRAESPPPYGRHRRQPKQ